MAYFTTSCQLPLKGQMDVNRFKTNSYTNRKPDLFSRIPRCITARALAQDINLNSLFQFAKKQANTWTQLFNIRLGKHQSVLMGCVTQTEKFQ